MMPHTVAQGSTDCLRAWRAGGKEQGHRFGYGHGRGRARLQGAPLGAGGMPMTSQRVSTVKYSPKGMSVMAARSIAPRLSAQHERAICVEVVVNKDRPSLQQAVPTVAEVNMYRSATQNKACPFKLGTQAQQSSHAKCWRDSGMNNHHAWSQIGLVDPWF